jgi:hypothetical protein
MIIRKRGLTLLEIMIASVLTAMVIFSLLFFYRQVGEISLQTDRVRDEHFKMRHVEGRLMRIFPRAISAKDELTFFSFDDDKLGKEGSQTLIFTFDNDITLDKRFANTVVARLFVDPEGRLWLVYWPSPKRWTGQTAPPAKWELLLDGVKSVSYEFFIAPDREEAPETPSQTPPKEGEVKKEEPKPTETIEPFPKGDWRKQPWVKEFNKLPAMVKMVVVMDKENQVVTFALPVIGEESYPMYD